MINRKCALFITTLALAITAPAVTPALPAQAAAYVTTEQTVSSSLNVYGKFVRKQGKVYYHLSDGTMKTGWVLDSGKWYYFDRKDGHMVTGWLKYGSKKYYLKKDGSMIEGPRWVTLAGKKYYFTKNGHVRAAWELIGGKWYYRNTEGTLIKNRWVLYGGKYYYLTATGAAATGTKTIQGRIYTFDNNGALTDSVPSYVVQAAKSSDITTVLKSSVAEDKKTSTVVKTGSTTITGTTTAGTTTTGTTTAGTTTAGTTTTGTTTAGTTSSTSSKTTSTGTTSTTSSKTTTTSTTSSTSSKTTTSGTTSAAAKTTSAAITTVVGKLNSLPASKKNFVINIAKYVRKYAPKYGIKVYSPIIAQAIHESGWGQSSLAYKYHNYFGLKCGTLWTGKSVNLSTKEEYSAGTLTTIRSNFRVYDNMEQGVKGYFEFIQLPRYSNLKGVTSAKQYLTNIKNDGYATGYSYVEHTMALVNLYNLTQFDK